MSEEIKQEASTEPKTEEQKNKGKFKDKERQPEPLKYQPFKELLAKRNNKK